MPIRKAVALACLAWLLTTPLLLAQEADQSPSYRTEAVGKINTPGDPQQLDKDAAIASALCKIALPAIEKSSLSASSQRICKAALGKLDLNALREFFANPEIVSEKTRTGYYEVKVGASLKQERLESWWAQFQKEPAIKKLRVMIVIPEYHIARRIPDPAAETEMIKRFVREGFRVVDQAQVKTIRDKDLVKRAMKDDPKELLAIAQSYGAELLLVGEAFSEDVPPISGQAACRARVEARILLCDTGEIIVAGDKDAGAADLASAVAAKAALRNAATKLSEEFIADLLVRNIGATAGSKVKVILAGADFEQKLLFKRLLEGMRGLVDETEEISYMESRAEFEVTTSATSAKLAEELFLAAKKDGMNLKVAEQSNRRCVFEIKQADKVAKEK